MNELHIKHLATNVWQRVTPFAATPFALREKLARGEAELYPYSTVTVNTTLSHQTCLDMLRGGAGQSNQRLPRAVDHLLHRVRYCQRSGQMLIRCYSDYLYNPYLCKKKKKTSTAFLLAKVKYRNQLFALRIICVGMCRRRWENVMKSLKCGLSLSVSCATSSPPHRYFYHLQQIKCVTFFHCSVVCRAGGRRKQQVESETRDQTAVTSRKSKPSDAESQGFGAGIRISRQWDHRRLPLHI